MYSFRHPLLLILFLLLSFIGCDSAPRQRAYKEVVLKPADSPQSSLVGNPQDFMQKPPMAGQMDNSAVSPELMASVSAVDLSWKTPVGWREEAGSGMRVVSFYSDVKAVEFECSIVSLGGSAGGLEANIIRWMRQVNISAGPEEVADFIARQRVVKTKDGTEAVIIDLTGLQKGLSDDFSSMVATVIEYPDKTLFVKFTGKIAAVTREKENFINLVTSLSAQP